MLGAKSFSLGVGLVFLGVATIAAKADQSLVDRGAYLARAGDCEACHTAPGNKAYAGGEAIATPFGPMYPPNITPDKDYGIGDWSDDDFYRALHEGIRKDGAFLYPAFPYQWFTKITKDDVHAIRAYLNTIPAVHIPSKPPRLMFPFNVRAGIGAWNAAFFKPGVYVPDDKKSADWNRGAYLVEGLGHCGDCHTPKGVAMEPLTSEGYSGGKIQDWYAPDITSDKQGVGKWSEDDLAKYLKTGIAPDKSIVAGKMSQVVHDSLSYLTDADVHAIAVYLKALPPIGAYQPERPASLTGPHAVGETVYLNNCASCHQLDGKGLPGSVPALAGNGLVTAKGPENVIRVILGGHLAEGTYAPMAAQGPGMSDQDIADVTDYVRNAWSNEAPVISETGLVGDIRSKTWTTILGEGGRLKDNDPCYVGEDQSVPNIVDPQHQIDDKLKSMRDDTMLQTVPSIISRVHQLDPKMSQADIVNGLMLSYCRVENSEGAFSKPHGRRALNNFAVEVYSELVSNEHE